MTALALLGTSLGDGRGGLVLDAAGRRAASLERLDDAVALGVTRSDLAEDDVAAVEPRGDDGGDEELGAVAIGLVSEVPGKLSIGLTCWDQRWPWTA